MFRQNAFDSSEIIYRAEELMSAADNRYLITLQVANRAKRLHSQEFNPFKETEIKPTIRAIMALSDELTQVD